MKVSEKAARDLVETGMMFREADSELDKEVIEERATEMGRSYGEVAQAVAERYLAARKLHQKAIAQAEGS